MSDLDLEEMSKRFEKNGTLIGNDGCFVSPYECEYCPEIFKEICGDKVLLEETFKKELRKARLKKLLS